MDYENIYNKIIEKAKDEKRQKLERNDKNFIYYESHHIKPRCLGGLDDDTNLVLLTAREHYLCHLMLHKMHPENPKLCAAVLMTLNLHLNSSRKYAKEREKLTATLSELYKGKNNPIYGKNAYENKTEEEMENISLKISKALKGKTKGFRIRNIKTGQYSYCKDGIIPEGWEKGTWKYSEASRKKMSESAKKRGAPACAFRDKTGNSPFAGKHFSEESKRKLSEAKKGKYVGKKWYNNGIKEIICYESEKPENYKPGRISQEIKESILLTKVMQDLYSNKTQVI